MTGPSSIVASAPGKMVLLGEYAVLFGHPALVTAVDRHARVELAPTAGRRFSAHAPGLTSRPQEFEIADDGRVLWSGDSPVGLPLVEGVVHALVRAHLVVPGLLPRFAATLDTAAFRHDGPKGPVKLGIGSSAALTVALASAVLRWADADTLPEQSIEWLTRLRGIHRDSQGGRGSGIDIAASLLGGVVEYRLDSRDTIATARHVPLPDALHMVVVWTGRSADTGSFLEQLWHRLAVDPKPVAAATAALGAASRDGISALHVGRVDRFLDAVGRFFGRLDELGRVGGMQIVSDVHRAVADIASDCGAVYKPSGAGGGDVGVAFTDDPEVAERTADGIRRGGFEVVEIASAPEGGRTRRWP